MDQHHTETLKYCAMVFTAMYCGELIELDELPYKTSDELKNVEFIPVISGGYMDQETEQKQDQCDQETKHTSKSRTKTVIKLKQENNDSYDIIIRKGNFIVSLD